LIYFAKDTENWFGDGKHLLKVKAKANTYSTTSGNCNCSTDHVRHRL